MGCTHRHPRRGHHSLRVRNAPSPFWVELLCTMPMQPCASPLCLLQLVKVICKSSTFPGAVQKMQRALHEFHIRGIKVCAPVDLDSFQIQI
jgi:hypothetical protein